MIAKNIYESRYHFEVDVWRMDGRHRVKIKKKNARAMALAINARDKILRANPKIYSNTGHIGVSESTHWKNSRPSNCFCVSWRSNGKRHSKRIFYGKTRARATALRMAVALRKENTK